MKSGNLLKELEEKQVRMQWEEGEGKWYYAAVDLIRLFTDSANPRAYWSSLKKRLEKKGDRSFAVLRKLRIPQKGKRTRLAEVIDSRQLFRVIQAVNAAKAEPYKDWLAKAGQEYLRELNDPERSLDRALDNWRKMGRSEKWILQRMMSQETRNRLTQYWGSHGIRESDEFRSLTNLIHETWSDFTVQGHKELKGLKSQNLRDHMNESELIFMALAEVAVRLIAESVEASGLEENQLSAQKGGEVARQARENLETKTGRKIVSEENYLKASGKKNYPEKGNTLRPDKK